MLYRCLYVKMHVKCLRMRMRVCMFACELTHGTCSNSVSQPLQYIEDAKMLSEQVFGLFMEVVQYNNDSREVSLYS